MVQLFCSSYAFYKKNLMRLFPFLHSYYFPHDVPLFNKGGKSIITKIETE